MSEQEFEAYLRLLGRFLRLTETQREAVRTELRDHMEERLRELLERGYSRDDIEKICSGNLLRVWSEVERVAAELQDES